MALHLNYDGNQNNGIIFNDKYPNGALFIGAEFKPKLSFQFDSFNYSEAFPTQDSVILNGAQTVMTDAQAEEIKQIAISWVQPLGQEGNPTLPQAQQYKQAELQGKHDQAVRDLIGNLSQFETASWTKQEAEARAYTADNTVATPLLDTLIVSRGLGETKDQLATKIIANADSYATTYGALLGAYQAKIKAVLSATDVASVQAIS